jgi:hypothetical protein
VAAPPAKVVVSDQPVSNAGSEPSEPLTDEQMRQTLLELAFGGSPQRFEEFCQAIREVLPPSTRAILRGSAITGVRWKDGAAFDADGPGTSDLDLTLVGPDLLALYTMQGFFVPGVHTKPLSDDDPDIAPDLVPLRTRLMAIVGRPVNIQATRDIVMFLRGEVIGQPYLTLVEKAES